MAEAVGDAGDREQGPNSPASSHVNRPESSDKASVNNPKTSTPDGIPHPAGEISSPTPSVQSDGTTRHPITQELLSSVRAAELRAWALQKGKAMGINDTDKLGDVTAYVFAGALAFEDTVQMRNLVQKRRVRQLQLRRAITVNRQQNAQACIAFLCGRVAPKPCVPCSRGSGPFTECVTVEGSLLGACASCHYGGEGNRCTFHISKTQKGKSSSHAIPVEDSEEDPDEGYPHESILSRTKKRGQKAVTVEQSGLSAAQSPRKFRKQPWRHFENDDTEAPDQSPKKQKTKDTEPKTTYPKTTTLKTKELKPTKPETEAVPHRKVTLR